MTAALWLLLRLQLRGWGRYLVRGMGSVRGLITAVVGFGMLGLWVLAMLARPEKGGLEPAHLARYGPSFLLLYCLANVVFSSSDRAIYFTPAEVQFLFAGPFTRRHILTYKIVLTLLVSLPVTVFLLLVIQVQGAWWLASLLGFLLASTFMQLFTILLGLMGSALGEAVFSRGRKLVGAAAAAALAALVVQAMFASGARDLRQVGEALLDSPGWRAAELPVRSFFDVILVPRGRWAELLVPLAVAAATNVALLGLIFAMDAQFLEASAASSARTYARLQRLRGKAATVEGGPPLPESKARFGLPMPPYWGGIGPVFWRQLTTASRSLGRLVLVLVVLGATAGVPMVMLRAEGGGRDAEEVAVKSLGGMVAWATVFLTALVPYDFRGDIDRIGALKALPVPPWRLALGQLLTPVLLLSLIHWAAAAAAAALAPRLAGTAALAALYVLPFNFVLIGLENLLFLLFPVRLMANTPGDFQAVGRNVLLAVGKMLGLLLVAMATAVVWVTGWLLTRDVWLGGVAALPVVVLAGAALVPLVTLAFGAFDVGRDTPA